MPEPGFDATKAQAFADRLIEVLNGSFLAMSTSIGHQTGLFDCMAQLAPSTSQEIARAAGLDERYVREWLGAMVVGRIAIYDPDAGTYALPPEHAASLTRAAGGANLANLLQWVACIAPVEPQIAECFRKGGGVPYSAYERFHAVMADVNGATFDDTLLERTLPSIEGLVPLLESGIDALDLGCGSGHAVNLMAAAFPKSRFTGSDFSEQAVAAARSEAQQRGVSNARFVAEDAAALPAAAAFDLITTFDAIHDQAQPARVLANIARALRDDGIFLMVDIAASSHLHENLDHPLAPFLYSISTLHCMTVSLADDGAGLGTVWGEQKAREMLAEAGFARVDVKRVEGDVFNNYFIARKR